ncbi:MAG: MFS transporter [Chloroflexi bacterium]|nr:MFS transporter [Chloroflexota bacterium]
MALDGIATAPMVPGVPDDDGGARPTERLPLRQLFQLSIYWLGINTIMGGLGVVVQKRIPALVAAPWDGPAIALQSIVTMLMAAAIQPTIGMLSDYTVSRWGRRKPYIAIGATLDVLFLIGIGLSNSYVTLVTFLVLVQFSSNFAQGPFQGFVPDLVPQKQVAFASALVGIMQTAGFVLGTIVITYGVTTQDYLIPLVFLGLIELATAVGTILWVQEGRRARDRKGRSWRTIARSAWGTDILAERSFLNLVLSRLMFLAGVNMLLGFYILFMERSLLIGTDQQGFWIPVTSGTVALLTLIATIPSARLSDRVGRKPVIYAACAIGAIGMAVTAVAPSIEVFVLGVIAIGVASGTFLAVDWALMTDIIPKASSGRYMGISNIAVVAGGPFASVIGGTLLFFFGGAVRSGDGPRAAFAAAIGLFVLAAFFLRRVDATPHHGRLHDEIALPAA